MSEGKKEVPEFLIFDRLDELENITLELMEKADLEKPSVEIAAKLASHATAIAEYGFIVAWGGYMGQFKDKSKTRAVKDLLFEGIRGRSVIAQRVDVIERLINSMLDDV